MRLGVDGQKKDAGPRQAGKSTLARHVVHLDPPDFYDLEDPRDLARLAEPMLALSGATTTVVIDEAQLSPGLFPILRVLVDEDRRPGRFLVLGSASPDLVGLSSESLAGRMETVALYPLAAAEVLGSQPSFIDGLFTGQMPDIARIIVGDDLVEMVLTGGYPEMQRRRTPRRRAAGGGGR